MNRPVLDVLTDARIYAPAVLSRLRTPPNALTGTAAHPWRRIETPYGLGWTNGAVLLVKPDVPHGATAAQVHTANSGEGRVVSRNAYEYAVRDYKGATSWRFLVPVAVKVKRFPPARGRESGNVLDKLQKELARGASRTIGVVYLCASRNLNAELVGVDLRFWQGLTAHGVKQWRQNPVTDSGPIELRGDDNLLVGMCMPLRADERIKTRADAQLCIERGGYLRRGELVPDSLL